MIETKDLVEVADLFFTIENDSLFCFLEEISFYGYENGLDYTIAINFSVNENSVIKWRVNYERLRKHFEFNSIAPEFKLYNFKKTKIKDVLNSDVDDFWFYLYVNRKGDKFFLVLNTENAECIKDITDMKNGDKVDFRIEGKYYILSFTVELS